MFSWFRGIAAVLPGLEAAGQGPDVSDPSSAQQQRRPGAGGLIGSVAVQDQFPVGGDG